MIIPLVIIMANIAILYLDLKTEVFRTKKDHVVDQYNLYEAGYL